MIYVRDRMYYIVTVAPYGYDWCRNADTVFARRLIVVMTHTLKHLPMKEIRRLALLMLAAEKVEFVEIDEVPREGYFYLPRQSLLCQRRT